MVLLNLRYKIITRFGPNRPAADMKGNGEFDFRVIYEDFCRIVQVFLEEIKGNFLKL